MIPGIFVFVHYSQQIIPPLSPLSTTGKLSNYLQQELDLVTARKASCLSLLRLSSARVWKEERGHAAAPGM